MKKILISCFLLTLSFTAFAEPKVSMSKRDKNVVTLHKGYALYSGFFYSLNSRDSIHQVIEFKLDNPKQITNVKPVGIFSCYTTPAFINVLTRSGRYDNFEVSVDTCDQVKACVASGMSNLQSVQFVLSENRAHLEEIILPDGCY